MPESRATPAPPSDSTAPPEAMDQSLQDAWFRFTRMVESSVVGMWSVDAEGHTTYINQHAQRLTGYGPEDLYGVCVLNLLDEETRNLLVEIQNPSTWDASVLRDVLIRRKDGGSVWVSAAISPVYTEAQAFGGALCLLVDATERRLAQESLRRSERQLRLLSDSAMDIIVRVTRDEQLAHISRSMEAITGVPNAALLGCRLSELDYPIERIKAWSDCIRGVLETGQPATMEFTLQIAGGKRHYQSIVSPEYDEAGCLASCLCVSRDVTERDRLLEQHRILSDASAVLSTTLDYQITVARVVSLLVPNLADGCLIDVLDETGRIRRIATVHRDPEKQAILQEIHERFPYRDEGWGISGVIRSGQPEINEKVDPGWFNQMLEDPDHRRLLQALTITSSVTVPLIADERRMGSLTMLSCRDDLRFTLEDMEWLGDLARRCALAMDNARLYKQVQESNEIKDECISLLSHEFRNPLAALRYAFEVLRASEDPTEAFLEVRAHLEHEVNTLARLADDLVDVARIARGRIALEPRAVNVSETLDVALDRVRRSGEEKGQTLRRDDAADVYAYADPMRLEQVITNVLGNAIKFTPDGGRIEVSIAREGRFAVIRVQDSGDGMDADTQAKVFEPFFQARRYRGCQAGGLGLGLALVRQIVNLHGGEVHLFSEGSGKGTTVTVRWPLAADMGRPLAPPHREPLQPFAGRLLLVEDHEFSARMLKRILEDKGLDVSHADRGEEALLVARDRMPDAAVLDIGLPDMDGCDLAARLRALPGGASLKLIALTGFGQPRDAERVRAAGFDHHLVKPVDLDRLFRLLGVGEPMPERPPRAGGDRHGSPASLARTEGDTKPS